MRVIGIAKEELGTEEFIKDWWKAEDNCELFYDVPKTVPLFFEANGRKMLWTGVISYLTHGAVRKNADRAKAAGIKGNKVGEGVILGSVLVIDKNGELILHHKELSWGDHPSDEVLKEAMAKLTIE